VTEQFDDHGFEAEISGAWVDLTPDVLHSPAPRWGRGIIDNGPLDRVGDATSLVFSLRNDAGNAARTAGYYSPGNPDALSGWTAGIPIRLWFEFEGARWYKFYGRIEPDGISIKAGLFTGNSVQVSVHNFMSQASAHELDLLAMQTNVRIDTAVPYILSNMVIQPLATEYDTGQSTFPTAFDTVRTGTKANAEFQKLAISEFGYIYDKGDLTGGETLVVEGRNSRSNVANMQLPLTDAESEFLLDEDGNQILDEDNNPILANETQEAYFDNSEIPARTQISYGKHIANKIKASSYPRRLDTGGTVVLYSLQKAFQVFAGAPQTIRGAYRDPVGGASYVNADPDSMSADYAGNAQEDGLGSDLSGSLTVSPTFGTSEVEFVLSVSQDLWVTQLDAVGNGIYLYDAADTIFEDEASQTANGVQPLTFDMKYQDDPTVTAAFAEYTLGLEKDPHVTIDRYPLVANKNGMNMYAFLVMEPGARGHFIEGRSGQDGDFFVMGYEAELVSGSIVNWLPVLKSAGANSFWVWDTSAWGVDTTWSFPE
jgi:hypothetical protein